MATSELENKVSELDLILRKATDFESAETLARALNSILSAEFDEGQEGADIERQSLFVRVLDALSISLWRRGKAREAKEYAERAVRIAELLQSNELIAKTAGNLAIVYRHLSEYSAALEYSRKAIEIHRQLNLRSKLAANLGSIASIHLVLSDYSKALDYYAQALAINEELGERAGMAPWLGGMGIVYHNLGDLENALTYHRRALAIDSELGRQLAVAKHLSNIASVYYSASDYPNAIQCCHEALDINQSLGNAAGESIQLGSLGLIYTDLEDYSKALEFYTKALDMDRKLGRREGEAICLGNIGRLYSQLHNHQRDLDLAEKFLLESLVLCNELGLKIHLYQNHKYLSEIYDVQERWKEQAVHLKHYILIKDEVQTEDVKRQATMLIERNNAAEREKEIEIERTRATAEKNILNNILPEEITQRLIKGENPIADHFDCVSVLFMDIVDFTPLASSITAQQLVHLLNAIFSVADAVMREFGLEKIKTIGDAYMAVAGAPIIQEDHAQRAAQAALRLLEVMENLVVTFPDTYGDRSWIESIPEIKVRIGLHCGPVAAGVVGENKFLYDLWGDAVNTAARMESHGEAGKIHVSEEFINTLIPIFSRFDFAQRQEKEISENPLPLGEGRVRVLERGEMEIKGKGTMKTYYLERL